MPPPKVYTKNTKTQQHSLLSTLAQGASFGAGSEVGHTLVKSWDKGVKQCTYTPHSITKHIVYRITSCFDKSV